jgi:hypothetical protein
MSAQVEQRSRLLKPRKSKKHEEADEQGSLNEGVRTL